jgi:hypothetical protein
MEEIQADVFYSRHSIPIPKEFGQITMSPALLQRIANTLGEI